MQDDEQTSARDAERRVQQIEVTEVESWLATGAMKWVAPIVALLSCASLYLLGFFFSAPTSVATSVTNEALGRILVDLLLNLALTSFCLRIVFVFVLTPRSPPEPTARVEGIDIIFTQSILSGLLVGSIFVAIIWGSFVGFGMLVGVLVVLSILAVGLAVAVYAVEERPRENKPFDTSELVNYLLAHRPLLLGNSFRFSCLVTFLSFACFAFGYARMAHLKVAQPVTVKLHQSDDFVGSLIFQANSGILLFGSNTEKFHFIPNGNVARILYNP